MLSLGSDLLKRTYSRRSSCLGPKLWQTVVAARLQHLPAAQDSTLMSHRALPSDMVQASQLSNSRLQQCAPASHTLQALTASRGAVKQSHVDFESLALLHKLASAETFLECKAHALLGIGSESTQALYAALLEHMPATVVAAVPSAIQHIIVHTTHRSSKHTAAQIEEPAATSVADVPAGSAAGAAGSHASQASATGTTAPCPTLDATDTSNAPASSSAPANAQAAPSCVQSQSGEGHSGRDQMAKVPSAANHNHSDEVRSAIAPLLAAWLAPMIAHDVRCWQQRVPQLEERDSRLAAALVLHHLAVQVHEDRPQFTLGKRDGKLQARTAIFRMPPFACHLLHATFLLAIL